MNSARPSLILTQLLARMPAPPIHPARARIHLARTPGELAADLITAFAGSWPFVLLHVVWFTVWLLLRLDINLLTLIVSLEAIFLATFVLMSQNRQASKDERRDDTEAVEVEQLTLMNQQQLTILAQQNEILALLKAQVSPTSPTSPTSPAKQATPAPISRASRGARQPSGPQGGGN
jgi:uncharacterized membrane protein